MRGKPKEPAVDHRIHHGVEDALDVTLGHLHVKGIRGPRRGRRYRRRGGLVRAGHGRDGLVPGGFVRTCPASPPRRAIGRARTERTDWPATPGNAHEKRYAWLSGPTVLPSRWIFCQRTMQQARARDKPPSPDSVTGVTPPAWPAPCAAFGNCRSGADVDRALPVSGSCG